MSKSIEKFLTESKMAVDNGINKSSIAVRLGNLGYGTEQMNVGVNLVNEATQLHQNQKKEYGEQYAATDYVDMAIKALNGVYMNHLQLARIVFKNERGISEALQLTGKRKRVIPEYLAQVGLFYNNALSTLTVMEGMKRFNVLEEHLQNGLTLLNSANAAYQQQKKEKGEAQEATELRDAKLEELEEWMGDYLKVARIAVADSPQLLEALGIVVS
ncbi:hypothetical protein DMA11_13995 [Marinilabiliaceae bacterium JC017]|nr:hypothetical protein DMA11_13995 [Marinilabiliaceae bacterium JC017]